MSVFVLVALLIVAFWTIVFLARERAYLRHKLQQAYEREELRNVQIYTTGLFKRDVQ